MGTQLACIPVDYLLGRLSDLGSSREIEALQVAASVPEPVEARFDMGGRARRNHRGKRPKGIGGQIGRERTALLAELYGHQEGLARRSGRLLTERAGAEKRNLDAVAEILA